MIRFRVADIYLGIDNNRMNFRCVTKSRVDLVMISMIERTKCDVPEAAHKHQSRIETNNNNNEKSNKKICSPRGEFWARYYFATR